MQSIPAPQLLGERIIAEAVDRILGSGKTAGDKP